jgi:hypothetical protein
MTETQLLAQRVAENERARRKENMHGERIRARLAAAHAKQKAKEARAAAIRVAELSKESSRVGKRGKQVSSWELRRAEYLRNKARAIKMDE